MSFLQTLVGFAVLWGHVLSIPMEQMFSRKMFTLEQFERPRRYGWHAPSIVRRTYLKYGVAVPETVSKAYDQAIQQNPDGTTSIGVRPVKGDVEYLVTVQVGNHNLSLDLDSGSSDLWVFSTLQPEDERDNRPVSRVYDPDGSNAKLLQGHTWQIRYGDMSGANGQVFIDNVTVGDITVTNQAVEAASSVSRTFTQDNANDGLLGMAFSKLNTVKPNAQRTWFENVLPHLATPVFTATLKRRAVGTYDFGFIDNSKYKGDITYTNVVGDKGFWNFESSGFIVGDGQTLPARIEAIIDTGTSLWYLPREVADAYWMQVPGATFNTMQAGFIFPCNAKLPDMSLVVEGKKVTVPGINMNYQTISSTSCYGGIQRDTGMPFSIFGDVFLKGLFVVFEAESGRYPRLGFASQSGS